MKEKNSEEEDHKDWFKDSPCMSQYKNAGKAKNLLNPISFSEAQTNVI